MGSTDADSGSKGEAPQPQPSGSRSKHDRGGEGSLMRFWWIGSGLGLIIAVWLLSTGHLLVGALIGGLAVFRMTWMVKLTTRRRRSLSAAGTPEARRLLRSMARAEFIVAGGVMGLEPRSVRDRFEQGQSIAEMAGEAGVPIDAVTSAIVEDVTSLLDREVAEGSLSVAGADQARSLLPRWSARMIQVHQGDLAR